MRSFLALLVVASLACGGAVGNARQAARDRIEQELAERVVEYGLGLDGLDVQDGRVVMRKDGVEWTAGTNEPLPTDLPITLPGGAEVMNVTRMEGADETIVSVVARLPGPKHDAAAWKQQLESAGYTVDDLGAAAGGALGGMVHATKGVEDFSLLVQQDGAEAVVIITWKR